MSKKLDKINGLLAIKVGFKIKFFVKINKKCPPPV
ncbi:MAG: hypothetical protein RL757_602 [Bacteroidota bacterium]|jgi:hypothetical protein